MKISYKIAYNKRNYYLQRTLKSIFMKLLLAQGSDIFWQKSFGGMQTDIGYSPGNAVDSGCIMATTAYSSDGDVSEKLVLGPFGLDLSYTICLFRS